MNTKIESLGVYLPDKIMTTKELMKQCRTKALLDLERLTGISERRVSDKEVALDLSINAVENAIKLSKYEAEDIDMIICSSLSRYNDQKQLIYEPSLSFQIKNAVNAHNAQTFDIVNACAGMFTGIFILDSLIKSGAIRRGIIVSGEQGSQLHEAATKSVRHFLDGQLASLTLGDCGAALILEASEDPQYGFHQLDFVTGAKYSDLCVGYPSEKDATTTMITKPVKLHDAGLNNGPPYIKSTLDKTNWHVNDVDLFIPHQTAARTIRKINKSIYKHVGEKVQENSYINVKKYGNTATTSHHLALHTGILDGTISSDNKLMFLIGASGLIIGNATYTMDDLPLRYKAAWGEN